MVTDPVLGSRPRRVCGERTQGGRVTTRQGQPRRTKDSRDQGLHRSRRGSRLAKRLTLFSLLAAIAVLFLFPAGAAVAAVHNLIPANSEGDPTDTFRADEALFTYATVDLNGGTICITNANLSDQQLADIANGKFDCSGGSVAWGSPNFVFGASLIFQPLEAPYLFLGHWRLVSDGGNKPGDDQIGQDFSVVPCADTCDPTIGQLVVDEWKNASGLMAAAGNTMCAYWDVQPDVNASVSDIVALRHAARGELEGVLKKGVKAAVHLGGVGVTLVMDFTGLPLAIPTPDFSTTDEKAIELMKTVICRAALMYSDIFFDPVDPNYTTVATPTFDAIPDVDPSHPEDPATALATSIDRQRAFGEAMLTAYERYQGALAAGDTAFVHAQSEAIANYGESLVREIRQTAVLMRQEATRLASDTGLAQPVIPDQATLDKITTVHERVRSSGFTAEELVQLQSEGFTAGEIAQIRSAFDDVDLSKLQVGVNLDTVMNQVADQMEAAAVKFDAFAREASSAGGVTNQPPIASFDTDRTSGPAPLTVNLSDTSTSPDLDPITSIQWDFGDGSTGTGSSVSHTYTAEGSYTVTQTVSDGLTTAQAEKTITVGAVGPTAADDALTTSEDSPGMVNVLANDSAAAGATLTLTGFGNGSNGTVDCTGAGSCTYVPQSDFNGTDSFTYTVDDGLGGSAGATVNVTVSEVNDPPVAQDDTATLQPTDASAVIDVLANDSPGPADEAGQTLTADAITAQPSHGSAVLITTGADAGKAEYTPNAGYNGLDNFSYRACDNGTSGGSADPKCQTATVNLTILAPPNEPPVAASQLVKLDENSSKEITLATTDADGDPLSYSIVDNPQNGTLSALSGNKVTYTPTADFSGTDFFSFKANDGQNDSNVATVSLSVRDINAPVYTPADVNTGVANGVAYIDGLQNADGSFGFSYPVAETGFAIAAYGVLDKGNFELLSPTYQAHLKLAVSWLLGQQDPTSGAWPGLPTYYTGIALEALSLSSGVDPGIPAAIAKGRAFLISIQNAPPAVTGNPGSPDCTGADGSGTENYCGGWNYDAGFGRSDESNTGFALTGLAVTGGVPAASAAINVEWQRHVQELRSTNPLATGNDGEGCYTPGYFCNANDTGSLLFGYGYDNVLAGDPKAAEAILIAQDTIDEYELNKATVRSSIGHAGENRDGACVIGAADCTWGVHGDGGYHYSIWALTKGLGQFIPRDEFLVDSTNWYDKVVDLLLSQQAGDGSWPQDGRDDGSIIGATSLAVSALGLVGVPPDLSITKTDSPDPVVVGDTLTYSLRVLNAGPSAGATEVDVTDALPAGTSFQSATPSQGSCGQAAGTVTCNLGSLANGASATVEIKVTPQNTGTITNTASVAGSDRDPNTDNNSATATTTVNPRPPQQADLRVTKSDSPDPVVVGQTLTYSIGVSNAGPDGATGVNLTDTLPAGTTFQSATPSQGSCGQAAGTATCNLGSLANGASATIEIKVTPQNAGTITNTASAIGGQSDPNTANNSATESTTINPPAPQEADLRVTKSDSPDPVVVGQTLTYSIGVSNAGPDGATGVTLTDTLPAGTSFQSATPSQGSCGQAAGTVTCNLGSLASGASATIEIKVAPQNTGTITNTASATGGQSDPDTANNSATATTTVGFSPVGPGCKVTGGGWIVASDGDRATFGGNAHPSIPPKGQLQYTDHGPANPIRVHSRNVLAITCSNDRTQATITGEATIDGQGSFQYRIDVGDLGEPGRRDTYRIRLSTGYDSGEQMLKGGNIQIHNG
jgi:uncharacterized repeat protein (TIGR01451 family)